MTTPKAQTEALMNDLVEFAEKMLSTHGEFHPFGGYLNEKNEIVHVGISPKEHWMGDQFRADALVDSFFLLARDISILAFGIATNVSRVDGVEENDAIRIFLEHRSGYCADVFFHYSLESERGATITHITAQQGIQHLFLGVDSSPEM